MRRSPRWVGCPVLLCVRDPHGMQGAPQQPPPARPGPRRRERGVMRGSVGLGFPAFGTPRSPICAAVPSLWMSLIGLNSTGWVDFSRWERVLLSPEGALMKHSPGCAALCVFVGPFSAFPGDCSLHNNNNKHLCLLQEKKQSFLWGQF